MIGKLGKKAARHDERTLMLAPLCGPAMPEPPLECDWTLAVKKPWGWMLNDKLGGCTLAGQGHEVQLATANHGSQVTVPDSAIQAAYESLGYNPNAPLVDDGTGEMVNPTDDGCEMLEALKQWRSIGIGGHEILAYAKVDKTNWTEIKRGISLFGCLYAGLALPAACDEQTGTIWSSSGAGALPLEGDFAPGTLGGHCVIVPAYTQDKLLKCVTWNAEQWMTLWWLQTYCDEMYVVVSYDWAEKAVKAPNGFDLGALLGYLHRLSRHRAGHAFVPPVLALDVLAPDPEVERLET